MQLQEIEQHISEGNIEVVEEVLDQLIQSTDFDLQYESAAILGAYGFLEQADRLYDNLLSYFPEEAQLKIDKANGQIELGQEDAALLLLSDVKSTDEEYVQALLALGDYYHMTGMTETAITKVQEAYNLLPNEPIIRFAYAELLLDVGRFSEAAQMYLALKDEVDKIGEVKIIARLAEAYSAGAAYEEAISYYEELLRESSTPDTLFSAAFAYYQIGQLERALEILEELIKMDPDYYAAYMLAGQTKSLVGDDEAAYEMFVDGIRRDAFDKELELSAGKISLKLNELDKAEVHLQEALALDPEYIEAIVTLASLYNETERDEELLALISNVNDAHEEIPILQTFLAYAYERTEQYENAYEAFVKAYDEMKDDHEFLAKYADFLMEEGKREEAIGVVKRLVALFPEDQNWRTFLETQTDEEV